MNMPSSNDLRYFSEAAITLNLSRASERLGISQPSLTLAIQRLEDAMGAPLLVRSKKGVLLTQTGKQLFAHSKRLLQEWEALKGKALASTQDVQGCYSVGCHASVGLYALQKGLSDLLEENPQLEIRFHHDLSRRVTESVIQMQTDIGIIVNPIKHPDLVVRKLCEDEVGFWVGSGNRKIQDLKSGEAVLICDPDLLQTQHLLKNLGNAGLKYRRIISSASLEVIVHLVECGMGIGIIPERVAKARSLGKSEKENAGAVRELRKVAKTPIYRDEICLLYRVENRGIRAIQAITGSIASGFIES